MTYTLTDFVTSMYYMLSYMSYMFTHEYMYDNTYFIRNIYVHVYVYIYDTCMSYIDKCVI